MARSAEQIRAAIHNDLPDLARKAFGMNLDSIIIYGSFLKPTFDPRSSDVNALVLVKEGPPAAVREFGLAGRRILRRNRITPLILTSHEFRTSADVFPMEYLDMRAAHEVITGRDATADLEIDASNLRHEVEHQLRGSLVNLRQLAIVSSRPRPFRRTLLRRRLEQWYGSLAAILRGLLRLYGTEKIPENASELLQAVNRVLGLEPGPFLQLLECRSGDCPDSLDLLDGLLERLAELVRIVDAGPGKEGS
jgi:hypothetical protein